MDESQMTLAEIRATYPKVVSALIGNATNYCVGGAMCLSLGLENQRFPQEFTLGLVLQQFNITVSLHAARLYAERIIKANDAGHIDEAWAIAAEAVEEKRE